MSDPLEDYAALFQKIAAALPGMETLSSTKQEDMTDMNVRSTTGNASQSQISVSYFYKPGGFTLFVCLLTTRIPHRDCHSESKSAGIIVNTVETLKETTLKAILEGLYTPGEPAPRIYCIGPLIVSRDKSGSGGKKYEYLNRLDLQPKGSVVFLSFGSVGNSQLSS
ncbi:UDP-glycosyltransferase 71B2-like [Mangifera indica]|uniref:UDP-glycosyltransferase 71B2-like n=1 Tax=Mangifera indica TaxID=29780 RepID=UPI001CFAC188|nr:UDP-glycosyltransferase 71B2-like [Mangifera indica]